MQANPLGPNPAVASPAVAVPGGPRPIAFPMAAPGSPTTAAPPMLSQAVVVAKHSALTKLVGLVASIGIVLGARFEWAGTQSAFKGPAMFLIDNHTRSSAPKLAPVPTHVSLTDIVGGGVWLTAIAGFVLALSPLLDRANFG
jgi:hypothetical protein